MPLLPSIRRPLLVALLIVFIDVLGFAIVIPLLPLYAERFNARPATIGLLIASYAACSLIAAPWLGRWSDRIGRKPVLMVSQLGTLLSFVLLALAPMLPAPLLWIFVARMVDGLTAGNISVARAYIADITPPRERSHAFGKIAAAFSFGYLVGPASAGALAQFGATLPVWLAVGVAALSLLATLLLLPQPPPPPPAATRSAVNPLRWLWPTEPRSAPLADTWRGGAERVDLYLWQLFGFLLAFSLFTSGIALFCERTLRWQQAPFGLAEVSWVLAYIGLLGLFGQLKLLAWLLRRVNEKALIAGALLLLAGAYGGLSQITGILGLLLCVSGSGLANSVIRPCLLGLISQAVPPRAQGEVSGLAQSLQSLALLIGPLWTGLLIDQNGLSAWALSCAGITVLTLSMPRWHHFRQHAESQPPRA